MPKWRNAGSVLCQRLRRWPNSQPAFFQRICSDVVKLTERVGQCPGEVSLCQPPLVDYEVGCGFGRRDIKLYLMRLDNSDLHEVALFVVSLDRHTVYVSQNLYPCLICIRYFS